MKRPIANRQLAIGNDLAVAEGFEPSIAGLTIRCLTNLATPQHRSLDFGLGSLIQSPRRRSSAQGFPKNKDQSPKIVFLEAMKGVEPLSFGLQDRRSVIQLSYIAGLVELRGVEP